MEKYFSLCGLYCGACPCMIATETGALQELSELYKQPVEELECAGCASPGKLNCEFVVCNTEKGLASCAYCSEMPCDKVTALNNDEWEHHSVIITNLKRIREIGKEEWLREQKKEWACERCGARTRWYQIECNECKTHLK